jgi:hypothetical protein
MLDTVHVCGGRWPEYKEDAARRDFVRAELQGLCRTSVSLVPAYLRNRETTPGNNWHCSLCFHYSCMPLKVTVWQMLVETIASQSRVLFSNRHQLVRAWVVDAESRVQTRGWTLTHHISGRFMRRVHDWTAICSANHLPRLHDP